MPIYVYECDTCGDVFEVEQRIIEDALTECPCGKGKVKRIIQPVGVSFKGSGFYVNDSVSAKSESSPKAETTPAAPASEAPSVTSSKES